ncbi:MAG: hypothetical protein K8R54_16725 [Bacteroidales bacterium]|nr:hypothetical protein [Bacteroidales bacterium]
MRKLIIVIIVINIFSCNNQENKNLNNREELIEAVNENTDPSLTESSKYYLENTKIEFDDPIAFKSTKNIAILVILEQKYIDKGIPNNSYFNIAIIDTSYTVVKLLFEESVIIDNVFTLEKQLEFDDYYYLEEDQKKYSKEYNSLIFFDLWHYKNRKKDYKRFFVYDLKNDNLKQLSPDNCNVISYNIFDNESKILIHYNFDSNKNGKFDEKDDENMVLLNPFKDIITKELFDLDRLKKIKLNVATEN